MPNQANNMAAQGQGGGTLSASGSPGASSLMNSILPMPQTGMFGQPQQSTQQNQLMQQMFQNMQGQGGVAGGHGGVPTTGTPQGGGMQLAQLIMGLMGGG